MDARARDVIQCTEAAPWDHNTQGRARVSHHGVHEVGDQRDGWPGGDIVKMRCRFCGHEWEVELPQ